MNTPFGEIMHRAVERIPGAVGGSFAASDGETVDFFTEWEHDEWALVTAHYGVLMRYIQSALNTFHFGEAELVIVSHRDQEVIIQSVHEGYYAMVVLAHPASLAHAMSALGKATEELRKEMA